MPSRGFRRNVGIAVVCTSSQSIRGGTHPFGREPGHRPECQRRTHPRYNRTWRAALARAFIMPVCARRPSAAVQPFSEGCNLCLVTAQSPNASSSTGIMLNPRQIHRVRSRNTALTWYDCCLPLSVCFARLVTILADLFAHGGIPHTRQRNM